MKNKKSEFIDYQSIDKFIDDIRLKQNPDLLKQFNHEIQIKANQKQEKGNVGSAKIISPIYESYPYSSWNTTGPDKPYGHGERNALLKLLNSEIPTMRKRRLLKNYNVDVKHSKSNIRRPASLEKSPDQQLKLINRSEYFSPLQELMENKNMSMLILTERPPCPRIEGCKEFFEKNLPKESYVISYSQNPNTSGCPTMQKQREDLNLKRKDWEQNIIALNREASDLINEYKQFYGKPYKKHQRGPKCIIKNLLQDEGLLEFRDNKNNLNKINEFN